MMPSAARCSKRGQNSTATPAMPSATPNDAAPRQPVAAKDKCLQQQKPDGRDGDDQRGEASRHPLLGPGQSEVAAYQQQAADGRQARLRSSVMRILRPQRRASRQHQRAGDGEAHGAHHGRRKMFLRRQCRWPDRSNPRRRRPARTRRSLADDDCDPDSHSYRWTRTSMITPTDDEPLAGCFRLLFAQPLSGHQHVMHAGDGGEGEGGIEKNLHQHNHPRSSAPPATAPRRKRPRSGRRC